MASKLHEGVLVRCHGIMQNEGISSVSCSYRKRLGISPSGQWQHDHFNPSLAISDHARECSILRK